MVLYTEAQLDMAWQQDCKNRAKKEKPWLHRETYRDLFEACLDLEISGMDEKSQYYLKTFDVDIPNEILNSIKEVIDLELELNDD